VNRPIPILLMSYDLRIGGTERQLAETALHLDRSLFSPHVACIRLQGRRRAEVERAGVPLVEFSFPSFASWRVLAAARRMAVYLKRHEIQLVHSFDVPANLFGVPVARASRVPVVLSSQRAYRELTPGVYHRLLRFTDKLVDGTVVNSAALRQHLQESDGIRDERLALVYNSLDPQLFSMDVERSPVLPHCDHIIGSTAVLRPEKGVATLVEAFVRLAPRFPSAGLLLVGGGPLSRDLEARIQGLGLRERVHFAGPVTNVGPWLRRMDVFVLPSLSEALSNSLLEAMAVGSAVVASRVGGNLELIQDPERLFRPGDAADLADKLAPLLADPTRRERASEADRAFVLKEFSRENAMRLLTDLYAKHLRRKGLWQ